MQLRTLRHLTWSVSPWCAVGVREAFIYATQQWARAGIFTFREVPPTAPEESGRISVIMANLPYGFAPDGTDQTKLASSEPCTRNLPVHIRLNGTTFAGKPAIRWERTVGLSLWKRFLRLFRGGIGLEWVLIHELGHSLGLGHSDSVGSIMFAHGAGEAMPPRGISDADLELLRTLYSAQSA